MNLSAHDWNRENETTDLQNVKEKLGDYCVYKSKLLLGRHLDECSQIPINVFLNIKSSG